jgi:predicted metal-dependent phosphoesterase TrpH
VRTLIVHLALLAGVVFLPPVVDPPPIELRCVDRQGDRLCPPDLARLVQPDRERITPWALFEDAAYTAADAGGMGLAGLLCFIALVPLVLGLWCEGVLCGVRRLVVTFALGIPICVALAYTSCFLEGRVIQVAPGQATEYVTASLHSQTHFTTGLLSPKQLVIWHLKRGFRVVNVSDKDTDLGGREAQRYAAGLGTVPPLLVLCGEEWHGRPDVVLVNVRRPWSPDGPDLAELVEGVRKEGGATILAHPWSKLPGDMSLDEALATDLDAVEIVNGVIHGGRYVQEAARRRKATLVGTLDYKFGPHVNVVTLIPEKMARSPAGVVKAIREGATRVVYAIPGDAVTGAAWEAGRPGMAATVAGFRTLFSTRHARRAVWFGWLALVAVLWRIATIDRGKRAMRPSVARIVFVLCTAATLATPAGLGWQVREWTGPIPVPVLLGVAAFFAVPLLASSEVLARIRRPARE